MHKILAGLLDMNEHCDNAEALAVARRFADWVKTRMDPLSDIQMQAMLGNEHGGMNEALANLYARTGETKYLALAERFNHLAVLLPASKRRDTLTGLHANTQIPKFIGTARQYELTGKGWLETASRFFWDTVVNERSYVIGGHSDGEMFSPKEKLSLALGPNTTETCNTYNMLKLTRHLFEWDPRAEYADYYERALLNHILASQNPESGMMCYYVPLRPGARKVYNGFDDAFWCCTGTGVENHAKYGDSIYFHDGDKTLYVNLFIASELNWKAKGLKLRQETNYPREQGTRLVFTCDQPVELSVKLRHPAWAGSGFAIKVNGEPAAIESKPGSYADDQPIMEERRCDHDRPAFLAAHRGLPRQSKPPGVLARAAGAVRPGRHEPAGARDRDRARRAAGGVAAGAQQSIDLRRLAAAPSGCRPRRAAPGPA